MRRPTVRLRLLLGGALASAAVGPSAPLSAYQAAGSWQIGPIIRTRNYSVGMPLGPTPSGRGWTFDFPYPDARAGHVHYVTIGRGSFARASGLTMRYRVEAAPRVRFVPQEAQSEPATVSLFFQRRGDSWSGRGRYEFYRWYAPGASVQQLAPGDYVMRVRFDDPNWVSVNGRPPAVAPEAFQEALADSGSVGILFGSAGARGHGVFATGPARFRLVSFDIR
jgi:hypothetical protein